MTPRHLSHRALHASLVLYLIYGLFYAGLLLLTVLWRP